VDVIVIVIDTVEVIATVDDSAPRQVNGSDHDQGGVHVRPVEEL